MLKSIISFLALALLLSFSLPAYAQNAIDKTPNADKDIDLIWGVKIPMRDGVKLNATVYKPKKMDAPLPVIFTLTPYIADTYHDRAYYFAQNGYVFALIDARGRGNSEGRFDPNGNEGQDGYDIVEWLARQPWSNGSLAMWGGSYAGLNQWKTAKEFPPHLKTIAPAASGYPCLDLSAVNNIFPSYEIQWVTYVSGVTANVKILGESSFWIQKFRELYLKHLPFKELDEVVGNPSVIFQQELQHPACDAYWEARAPALEQFRKINLPILNINGQYDEQQRGPLHGYRLHMQHAPEEARHRHYLILGPWDHSGTRTPVREIGGLKFGEAALLDMNRLHKEWYDWTLKGGKRPDFLKKRIAYYVMGAEEWRYADSLEAIPSTRRTLYLASDGSANEVFHSGRMSQERPNQSMPDKYVYDPLDVRPAELEREEIKDYLVDQRYVLNLFGNGLVYHSQPFMEDTEMTGNLKFVAWMAMDVPDTDFQVSVYEIAPDGASILLTEDRMRARYRESLKQERLVKPGEINRYEFKTFRFFSRRIAKGSRLRLVVRSPNSIYWQKNYNSGGVVAEESGKDARTAHVTLYHDVKYPSFLEIPLVK